MSANNRSSSVAAEPSSKLVQALAGCLFARALPGEIEGLDDDARAGIAGCALLGDGTVAYVLDIPRLP